MEFDIGQIKEFLMTTGVDIGLNILKAAALLVFGLWAVKWINRGFAKLLSRKTIDESLQPFLKSLVKNTMIVLLLFSVLATLGVQMTSFVAVIGAAGLAIGLSLQGTLQNLAGGVVILTIRPFKVGDFIEAQGYTGTVSAIYIFNTILHTVDNKRVVIPNGRLSNESIINFSAEEKRRVDMVFGISYDDDIRKAKAILEDIVKADDRVLPEPEYRIAVASLGDSSVNINCRPWVKTEEYWDLYWDFQEKVKIAFDEADITIPYPQRDVHMHQVKD